MSSTFKQHIFRRLLDARERGYSGRRFLGVNWRLYVVEVLVFSLLAVALALADQKLPLAVVLGLLAGSWLRDVKWFSKIRSLWSCLEAVIDWKRVQEYADGSAEQVAGPQPPIRSGADGVR